MFHSPISKSKQRSAPVRSSTNEVDVAHPRHWAGAQTMYGNQAVLRMRNRSRPTVLQRKCACGGECPACKQKNEGMLQSAAPQGIVPPIVLKVPRSPGQPLEPATRGYFEPRFGRSLGGVRIHADPEAAEAASAVDSLAFTVGQNVFFATGQYAPSTPQGRRLIAHELTHTLQQAGSSDTETPVLTPDSDPAEAEARSVSEAVMNGGSATPIQNTAAPGGRSISTLEGKRLFAHELADTVQQAGSTVRESLGESGPARPPLAAPISHVSEPRGNLQRTPADGADGAMPGGSALPSSRCVQSIVKGCEQGCQGALLPGLCEAICVVTAYLDQAFGSGGYCTEPTPEESGVFQRCFFVEEDEYACYYVCPGDIPMPIPKVTPGQPCPDEVLIPSG